MDLGKVFGQEGFKGRVSAAEALVALTRIENEC